MDIYSVLSGLSIAFAFGAALFWLLSAFVTVPREFPLPIVTTHTLLESVIGSEIAATGTSPGLDKIGRALIKQSQRSALAAGCAALAAIVQTIEFALRFTMPFAGS